MLKKNISEYNQAPSEDIRNDVMSSTSNNFQMKLALKPKDNFGFLIFDYNLGTSTGMYRGLKIVLCLYFSPKQNSSPSSVFYSSQVTVCNVL